MSLWKKPGERTKAKAHVRSVAEGVYGARRKIGTTLAALLALMVGYHVIFGQNGLTAYRAKRHEARDLQHDSEQLRRENDTLRDHVDRLSNDPGSIEHEAREELHYTRPGEVIYTLPEDKGAPSLPVPNH